MRTLLWACAAAATCMLAASCAAPQPQPASGASSRSDAAESIGSLRNARVAFPMAGTRTPLTFLAGDLTQEQLKELARVAPNVRIIAGLTREQALEHAGEAEGIEGRYVTPEFVSRAPHLVWVQSMSAGVERYLAMKPLAEADRIVLTNMRAAHGPAIADHAFAMLLTLTRDLRYYEAKQSHAQWAEAPPERAPIALQGRTMLVVGLGGIGSEIAQRAHGFGMRVTAIRHSNAPGPAYIERMGGPGDLAAMLPDADAVAVCVPLTGETRHLFDARMLSLMKPGSYLINVSRGAIVDTEALTEALRNGRLAGACLDVTDPEPLPADHPLWRMGNVLITPHVAADADLTRERVWTLFRENVRRFGVGEPLLNVVDKEAGY